MTSAVRHSTRGDVFAVMSSARHSTLKGSVENRSVQTWIFGGELQEDKKYWK
jgi:hypothetical protein